MTADKPRVLIVDDDQELAAMLIEFLQRDGFDARAEPRATEALLDVALLATTDLVVLDVMLPGRSGFDVLRELRARADGPRVPILMLTARGDSVDRILGLELGADDYLSKPFDPRELAARIRAILRRARATQDGGPRPPLLSAGALSIDLPRRRASLASQPLELTGAELRVLTCLTQRAGSVVAREDLTEQALGRPLTLYDRSIDTHVSNLRRKLTALGDRSVEIRAVRGAGYELIVQDSS